MKSFVDDPCSSGSQKGNLKLKIELGTEIDESE
jgi:hypothetical protein